MKKSKVLFTLFLCVLLCLSFALTSCDRKYDEAEVKAAAESLMKNAEKLNTVYYGRGIAYIMGGSHNGAYYEADPMHLRSLGFTNIKGLIELTEKTFTKSYSAKLIRDRLQEMRVDGVMIEPARYYQSYDDELMTEEVCIMVYSGITPIFDDRMTVDYSSMTVKGSKRDKVFVSVSVTVSNIDGDTQEKTLDITLIEEDDGWRIDNPVFKNYTSESVE